MNLFELLGAYLPTRYLRRAPAFVLGFALMCMYLAAKEVLAGRF
jgi:hypothetical protein